MSFKQDVFIRVNDTRALPLPLLPESHSSEAWMPLVYKFANEGVFIKSIGKDIDDLYNAVYTLLCIFIM